MADGLAERIKKLLRPVYEFRPGLGMGFGRGFSFLSQEDYTIKYSHLMPMSTWSSGKLHPDELDTPQNRAKLEHELVEQEIGMAYRMAQSISSKELTALYAQGREAKHQIATGNTFSIEYDQFGTPTHVKLDFGGGEEWRARVGVMSDAISQRERALPAEQRNSEQDRRDQVRATALAPVVEKLKKQLGGVVEVDDFVSGEGAPSDQQVNEAKHGLEWKEIDALADGFEPDPNQAALRLEVVERLRKGDIESLNYKDEGVSFHLDGDKLVETWTNPDQAFAWDADKCDIPLFATDIQHIVERQQEVAQEAHYELTDQDYQLMAEAEAEAMAEEKQVEAPPVEFTDEELKELAEEQELVTIVLEAEVAYQEDRERWVQQQIQENIEAGVVEDTDLYADYDRQAVAHKDAWESEEAYDLRHAEQADGHSDGRDREVFELYREAEYQHSEWAAGEREEAVDLSVAPEGVTNREWARAASDYKEWEQEYEQNRQNPTIDDVIQLDNSSAEDDERREHELELSNQLAHLRMPDGGTFVQHVQQRHEQGDETTKLGDVEYRLDGNDLVSRYGSKELRGDAGVVDSMIAERHKESDKFIASLLPAQSQAVSAVDTQNHSDPLNTQNTNDNQMSAVAAGDQKTEARHRPHSLDDIGTRALKNLEASGQQLRPEVEDLMKQIAEAQSQSHSQRQGQGQRI